jgi:CPA1 family monovalent cation:H+ antiporter
MHDLIGLELIVALGAAIVVSEIIAPRMRLPVPVLQLLCGVLLGFIPVFRNVHLPPQAVLLIFLPMLLYWESLTTSLREIRRNLRGIVLLSTALVIVTAAAVAFTAHYFGLAWAAAWVLGAALAPTDATAVGVLARSMPRRYTTILRAESLVNDGTALVIYALVVDATVHASHPSHVHIAALFALSYTGGIAAGLVTAAAGWQARMRLNDALQQNLVVLLMPFTAYLLAELVHASGVLAVVTCGLIMSQLGPRIGRPLARQQTTAFWGLATQLLNGGLFVLIGVELQAAVRGLSSAALAQGIAIIVVVAVALVLVRLAWLTITIHLIRLLDRRPSQRARRTTPRARVLQSVAGFRGAVSLAAALAVPQALDSGSPFPSRDLIIFITVGVIAVTLAQGVALPSVVRWARLPRDTMIEKERQLAESKAAQAALDALPELAKSLGINDEVADEARDEYSRHLRALQAGGETGEDADLISHQQQYKDLRRALIEHKRRTVIGLRDDGIIDDIVLRELQTHLDREDVRLSR